MTKQKGFEGLAALRDKLPAHEGAPVSAGQGVSKRPAEPKGPARAVVRLERKGRGGKEATLVEKLALPPAELEAWCKDLKAALGCGGSVDGDVILLQGDLRRRVEALLIQRGVRKVTVA